MATPQREKVIDLNDDGLPAPTKAQANYWGELCYALADRGLRGMKAASDWPADLVPSKTTLKAMTERQLIVRRSGVWRLKRYWGYRLARLRLVALPTPPLMLTERPAKGLPSYAELQAWEPICRWLDTQPKRKARLPFPTMPDLPVERLYTMRKFHLIQHTRDCCFRLSPQWKAKLQDLWRGVLHEEGEKPPKIKQLGDPLSVAFGLDTWYLNWLDPEGVPSELRMQLDALQAQAKDQDDEIETPWRFDGAPLLMYRSGIAAKPGQPSWSFILRNGSLSLRLRRSPLGDIVGQVQFSSECLWRLTAFEALNQLDSFMRKFWGCERGRWQVSQAHIAHDVMNTQIELEQLDHYVSRSRTQAIMEAAKRDIEAHFADHAVDTLPAMDWDDIYGGDDLSYDPLLMLGEQVQLDEVPVEERALTVYRWGRRLSGVSWSLGQPISLVQYDKALEMQRTGKKHMEAIWQANGRQGDEPVVRNEARLRRGAFRGLKVQGLQGVDMDDPWVFLEHLHTVWGYVVGKPDVCPDVVDVAWIRRVAPNEDTNRSRWPTDPIWKVVQMPTCAETPLQVRQLIRDQQKSSDVERRVRVMYGSLVSAIAIQEPRGDQWDISKALGEMAPTLTDEAAKPGKDFGELVRERKRKLGLPIAESDTILPFYMSPSLAEQTDPTKLDMPPTDAHDRSLWHKRLAERRMLEALDAWQKAEAAKRPAHEIALLEEQYQHEVIAHAAALGMLSA